MRQQIIHLRPDNGFGRDQRQAIRYPAGITSENRHTIQIIKWYQVTQSNTITYRILKYDNVESGMMESKMHLISNVLTIRKYAAIAAVTGIGLGILYFYLTMSLLPDHIDAVSKEYGSYIVTSIILTMATSVLGGINIALIVFKMKKIRMINSVKSNSSAFLGGAFAAFTPGCPACTAPLAIILGAVGGLSVFPMQGLELKMISVGVLAFSIYWISRGLQRSSCCSI